MKAQRRGGRWGPQGRRYGLQEGLMKERRDDGVKTEVRTRTDLASGIVAVPTSADPYLGLARTLRRGGGLPWSGLLMGGADEYQHAQNVQTGVVGCQMALRMPVTCPPRWETGPGAWWKMKPLHDAGPRILPPPTASPHPRILGSQPKDSRSSTYLAHQEQRRYSQEARAC